LNSQKLIRQELSSQKISQVMGAVWWWDYLR